jgi:hypothetical protein
VTKRLRNSTYALHAQWARLEDEHQELAAAIERARKRGGDISQMRAKQAELLLDINAVVADIRDAPASSLVDYLALLDVAIEHEIDLAADLAYYGPQDYPMIMRLLQGLAEQAPGFEFNSLRRWLSSPGQFEPVKNKPVALEVIAVDQPHSPGAGSADRVERRERTKVSGEF